jgi:salicylate hydroxylase
LAAEYDGWDAPVVEAIAALDEIFRWGIYDRPPLPYWSTTRVTLLGDAGHPMVPHFGQGSGQAIEDGFALAILLEDAKPADVPARLKAYEKLRLGHTSRVQAASRDAGRSIDPRTRTYPSETGVWTNGCRWPAGYFNMMWSGKAAALL